ncbi:hypothetical protein LTR15_005772 [Elasticomyces elasticus]|nr:hypothetical protein LTR15_005772 [Elasticomyces elasticus]
MPTLKIKPPRPPNDRNSSSSPARQTDTAPPAGSFTFSAPPPASIPSTAFAANPTRHSSIAPDYSPITPKVQPILPLTQYGAARFMPPAETNTTEQPPPDVSHAAIPPAQYIPQPAPLPFSSEDSTDAIALRAAISALQFQKKKAVDDLRTLEVKKKDALEHPRHFRNELVAGRMKERREQYGGVQAILDRSDSEDEDSDEGDKDATAGAERETSQEPENVERPAEVPDSQPSRPGTGVSVTKPLDPAPSKPPPDFSNIPGPQDIVRMPPVNWEKYHIVGSALDQMHEQQRRWPGSSFAYGEERGREHSVVAPYSPFEDVLAGDGEEGERKDSAGGPVGSGAASVAQTPTVSEHPMNTRRAHKAQGPAP